MFLIEINRIQKTHDVIWHQKKLLFALLSKIKVNENKDE